MSYNVNEPVFRGPDEWYASKDVVEAAARRFVAACERQTPHGVDPVEGLSSHEDFANAQAEEAHWDTAFSSLRRAVEAFDHAEARRKLSKSHRKMEEVAQEGM